MNRTIWIWRIIAILILLIFAILMWNLYADLTTLKRQRGGVAVESGEVLADGTRGGPSAGRADAGQGLRFARPGHEFWSLVNLRV